MPKVFLSHSSADKESYVRIVANKLIEDFGIHNCIYDELTFEEGMRSIEEIEKGLEKTDLFVLFLSDNAMKSEWVTGELNKAQNLFSNGNIKKIYPIIIDSNITFKDARIPQWLRDEYNLKYISRPTKAYSMIKQRLIEISWDIHPRLKEKEKIFVGRNDHTKIFEERLDSYDKHIPLAFFVSGVENIGRSSLLKYCLKKSNVIDDAYQPLTIYMNSHESIEDFIFKLYGLGYTSDTVDLTDFLNKSMKDKIELALLLLKDLQESREKLIIRDDGGIVTFDGNIIHWFIDIIENLPYQDRITIGVIAKFKVTMRQLWRNEKVFTMEVEVLEKKEREGLLKRYLDFENINLTVDDFLLFSSLLKGYPEQVYYAVELMKRDGLEGAKRQSYEVVNYSLDKVTKLLLHYEEDRQALDFLYFLSHFDVITYDFIFKIVGDEIFYKVKLAEFINSSICEFSGSNKEYLRVISPVKDYIQRAGLELSSEIRERLNEHIEYFLKNYNFEEIEIPEYLFSIKEALLNGKKIEAKYLIPSHFLKTMIELYDKKNKYTEVVRIADVALENAEFMDYKIVFEIRYYLCLSLARLRNNRFLKEVQNISGPDHNFLLGYFYRLIGKNDRALEELQRSLKERPNFSRAKRELVQVYIQLEEFETATVLAKEHYENDKTNSYHMQAYFRCIIRSEKNTANRKVLEEILENLSKIKSTIADEMKLRCKAQFLAIYDNREHDAIALINKAITDYPNLSYALYTKIEILEKFSRIRDMEMLLMEIEKTVKKGDYNYITFIKSKAILFAMQGNIEKALDLIVHNSKYIPEKVIDKIMTRIQYYDTQQKKQA
ncbi:TIR domain-containing protein [Paenibacillus sp. 2TAB23]|uniref:TIR domain-containing protein n=1 Tax=Paenibacillus sp. 2TAB23 TaxID=3233004 RepID=UPI003F953DF9